MKTRMKSIISLLLSAVLLLSIFPAVYAAPQKVDASDSLITVQITTDKSSYSTLGTARVKIVVTNTGSEPLDDVNVENILPDQLSALSTSSVNASYSSLEPEEYIEMSYEACLNPNKAPVNFFIKLMLKLKIFFKLLNGTGYAAFSDVAETNKYLFKSFNTTKDMTFGHITVTNLVKVSYLSLPEGTSSGTIPEIVTLYNTAANNAKSYKEGMQVIKSYGHIIDIKSTDSGMPGNLLGNIFKGYNPIVERGMFTQGNTDTKDFMPLAGNEKMSTLTAEGVKSASCIELDNGCKMVIINLISEHFTDMSAIPPVHSTCMDTDVFSFGDVSSLNINLTDKTYTGATIIAVVNGGIYLDYVYFKEPVICHGTMSVSGLPSFSFDIEDTWKQNISFWFPFSIYDS